jgi:phosphoribosylglycinamide formyltransferase-1
MPERFVSEPIQPLTETADTSRMAIGEPGLPQKFVWRGRTIIVTAVLRSWRETGKCRRGSPEMYVRKHWYEGGNGIKWHYEAVFRKTASPR